MAQRLGTQLIFGDVSQGVVTNVGYRIVPKNSVAHAVNFAFDESFGEAKTRKGTTLVGSQLVAENNTINGLYNFIDSGSGANSRLIAAVNVAGDANQSLLYLDGSSWTTIHTGDTAGLKTRFATFLDRVIRVNGTDATRAWDGSSGGSFSVSDSATDIGNAPIGKFIMVYKDQVLIAGIPGRPDDVDISSVPNTAGTAISWTSGNRRIRVNPDDRSNITGLGQIGSVAIIFKRFAMYRWNNRATEPDTVVDVGCSSQESVAVGGSLLFFFNEKGVWATSGGYPQLMSRRVQKWIDAISASYLESVAGNCDGLFYYCSIGNITLDGKTYNNVVLRMSLTTQEWAVFSYAHQFRVFAPFLDSSTPKIVGGDTTARVLQIESSSLTDNGTAISYELESHEEDFGSRGMVKEISEKIIGFSDVPVNAIMQIKIGRGDWKTVGTLNTDIAEFPFKETIKGNSFKFRYIGIHSSARMTLKGIELPHVELLDYGVAV